MKHILDFCGGTKDGTCVAFGHFDGIHLGHRAVIEKVCAHEGLVPVIVSADETFKPVIYTEREKEELLRETGVEIMVSVNARDYDSMTADELCSAVGGKVCREKRPAALGDGAGEKARAAGAFEHRVVWCDAGTNGGNERLVRFFIKDVGEEVIDPCDVVPEHEYFPLNVICFSTR